MTFKAFTEEQWNSVRAVRDDWPENIDWSEARQQIEGAGRNHWELRAERLRRGPPAKQRKKLDSVLRQTYKLQETLTGLADCLEGLPDPDLKFLEQRLKHWLNRYEVWAGPRFAGRNDYFRDMLEGRLVAIWERELRGELSFSRTLDGTPTGPFVDFLRLTLTAICGKAPGPAGIARMIDGNRPSGIARFVEKLKKRRQRSTKRRRFGQR